MDAPGRMTTSLAQRLTLYANPIVDIEYDVDRHTSRIGGYKEFTLASQRTKGTCSDRNHTASYSDALMAVPSATARIATHTQGITTKPKGAVRAFYHLGNAMP